MTGPLNVRMSDGTIKEIIGDPTSGGGAALSVSASGLRVVGTTVTRPADTTAYAAGDLIANSTTAGSVTPITFTGVGSSGTITKWRLRTNRASAGTGWVARLHLYRSAPTPSNGDNGAWLTNKAADWIGSLDAVMDMQFTDGAAGNGTARVGPGITYDLGSATDTLYALLETRSAYTPASGETFTPDLEIN